MDTRLDGPLRALQVALGLTATLAGLDKFFNILTNWSAYLSPAIASALPFSARGAERLTSSGHIRTHCLGLGRLLQQGEGS
jgi:hypothetical protein